MPRKSKKFDIKKFIDDKTAEQAIKDYLLVHPEFVEAAIQLYIKRNVGGIMDHLMYASNSKSYKAFRDKYNDLVEKELQAYLKTPNLLEDALKEHDLKAEIKKAVDFIFKSNSYKHTELIESSLKLSLSKVGERFLEKDPDFKKFNDAVIKRLHEEVAKTSVEKEVNRLLNRR